jgi:hypothetical protein
MDHCELVNGWPFACELQTTFCQHTQKRTKFTADLALCVCVKRRVCSSSSPSNALHAALFTAVHLFVFAGVGFAAFSSVSSGRVTVMDCRIAITTMGTRDAGSD